MGEIVSEEEVQPRRKMSVEIINGLAQTLCAGVSVAIPAFGGLINPACNAVSQALAGPLHNLFELISQAVVAEVLNILKTQGLMTAEQANAANELVASGEISNNLERLAPDAIAAIQLAQGVLGNNEDPENPLAAAGELINLGAQLAENKDSNGKSMWDHAIAGGMDLFGKMR